MSKKNVHPDYYKVGGRDRQDDAAAARQARAITAKPTSQQRPDRMTKRPWFQRPEATPTAASERPDASAQKKNRARAMKAKPAARKMATRKAARKPPVRRAKQTVTRKK